MRKTVWCVAVVLVGGLGLTLVGSVDEADAGQETPVLLLQKTVGTNPDECATESSISVPPGTRVWYCYTLWNLSRTERLHRSTLWDDQIGFILNSNPLFIRPGDSGSFGALPPGGFLVTADVTNTAEWTAINFEGMEFGPATATATVEVQPRPTPTPAVVPTPTPAVEPTPTPTGTVSPTVTPDPTPTATATVAPTAVPTPSPTPGAHLAFTGSSSGTLAVVGVAVGLLGVGLLVAGWRLRRNS